MKGKSTHSDDRTQEFDPWYQKTTTKWQNLDVSNEQNKCENTASISGKSCQNETEGAFRICHEMALITKNSLVTPQTGTLKQAMD